MTEPNGTPLYSPFVRGKRIIPLLTKEGLREVLWRLAILLLPWQTRWFSDASLAGWPWEQGRLSFYASWIPMLVLIIRAFRHSRENGNPGNIQNVPNERSGLDSRLRGNDNKWIYFSIGTLVAISAVNILRDYTAFRPILQWWIQIVILTFFILALWRATISSRSIATWVVISMIPHALIGVWQFASQHVIGSKWFGIASQLPQTLGVSVIAHDGLRILRAYGGFPHPNIFGGWLAVGLLLAIWLSATSYERRARCFWIASSSLFVSVLVLTFSRAAWLAAAVGLITVLIALLAKEGQGEVPTDRSTGTPSRSPFVRGRILFFPIIILSFVILSQRQHLFVRFDLSQRLEQKSVDQRVGSLRTGLELFLNHPLIGSGPNAELLTIAPFGENASAPLEPPHNAYLLALDDVGVIGMIAIAVLCFVGARFPRPVRSEGGETPPLHSPFTIHHSLFVILFILALFDHYLWSTWSGQTLVAIAILLIVEPKSNP